MSGTRKHKTKTDSLWQYWLNKQQLFILSHIKSHTWSFHIHQWPKRVTMAIQVRTLNTILYIEQPSHCLEALHYSYTVNYELISLPGPYTHTAVLCRGLLSDFFAAGLCGYLWWRLQGKRRLHHIPSMCHVASVRILWYGDRWWEVDCEYFCQWGQSVIGLFCQQNKVGRT